MTKINRILHLFSQSCCLVGSCVILLVGSCTALRGSNQPLVPTRAYHLRLELLPGSGEASLYAVLGQTPAISLMRKAVYLPCIDLRPIQYSLDIRLNDDTQLQYLLTGLRSAGIRVESVERNNPD